MAKPPPDRGDGVTPVQRQGYPSVPVASDLGAAAGVAVVDSGDNRRHRIMAVIDTGSKKTSIAKPARISRKIISGS